MTMLWGRKAGSILAGSVIACGLAACGGSDDAPVAKTTLTAAECTALSGLSIPAASIALPTGGAVVQAAQAVSASASGNTNGDYCKVTGIVKRASATARYDMQFEVNLPLTWNRLALQMGGGGYDGSLVTGLGPFTLAPASLASPVAQGYVTLGSDGGHQGGAGFDGTFGTDDEALANYGRESVKKTHDVATEIVKKAYGGTPQRFYFIGGSQGGHEALDAAARYPDDYDGVIAHYPAYNVTLLHLGSLNTGKALYENNGVGWMNAAKTKLITDSVYLACDTVAADGVVDGVISNPAACATAFDVGSLRCPSGADEGDQCLSDAQIAAARKIASPYQPGYAVAGMDTFPKWPLFEGALFNVSNFGTVAQPSNPLSGREALLYSIGDQTVKYIITRNATYDPLTFDPLQWTTDVARAASMMDVTNISLERFRAKGGKIIMTHGTADDFITPYNSIAYYNRQQTQFGQATLDTFMRFYLIPGLGHGFGPFNAKFDALTALRDWVEQGKAPSNLTAADENAPSKGSRPLCDWPKWPKFTGAAGTQATAASYTCTAP